MTGKYRAIPKLFLILLAGLAAVNLQSGALKADEPPATIAVVNGTALTESDLEFLYLSRDVRDELRASVREKYIEQLIDRHLLKEFLRSRKIQAPDSIVKERVEQAEKLINREGLNFDETLKKLGYTRGSFAEDVALPLAWRTHAKLVITDKAIDEYWKTNRSKFDGTEVRAAHIVKRVPDNAKEDDRKALIQALSKIRQAIADQESTFADAARENSESPSGKDGGDLGQFAFRGRMPQALTTVAFEMKPGEISEPFESPFGVHILTVTEIIPGDLSLEDARGEIFHELSGKIQAGLIKQLREKAEIKRP